MHHSHVHEDFLLMYIFFARRTHEHEGTFPIFISFTLMHIAKIHVTHGLLCHAYAFTYSYVSHLYDCIHIGGAFACYTSFQSFSCCSLYLYLKLWCMFSSITEKGEIESTSTPQVILVINVNISLVRLIFSSSIFQISPIVEWHGLEDVEPLQYAKDKGLAHIQSPGLYVFYFSDPRSHWVYRKSQYYQGGKVLLNEALAQNA